MTDETNTSDTMKWLKDTLSAAQGGAGLSPYETARLVTIAIDAIHQGDDLKKRLSSADHTADRRLKDIEYFKKSCDLKIRRIFLLKEICTKLHDALENCGYCSAEDHQTYLDSI